MKSSEFEYKAPGRDRALWLRGVAQSALERALASEWIDASLAEAALVSCSQGHAVFILILSNPDARPFRILSTSSV